MNFGRFLLLLVLTGLPLLALSQQSLPFLQQVKALSTPKEQINWLLNKTDSIIHYDLDLAYSIGQQAMQIAQVKGEVELIAKSQLVMANIHTQKVQYDSSLYYLLKAEQTFQQKDLQQELAKLYLAFQEVHTNQKELKTGIEYCFKAAEIYQQLDDKLGLATAYNEIAWIQMRQEEYEEALEYGDKALQLIDGEEADELKGTIHFTKGSAYNSSSSYDLALLELTQALEYLEKANAPPISFTRVVNSRGNTYKLMGNHEAAIKDYQNNLAICEKLDHKRGIMVANANLGHSHLLNKNYNAALPYLLFAMEAMESTNDKANLWEQYMHLSNTYEALGDFEKALMYERKLAAENEEYYEDKIDQLELQTQTKFETGQRQATIVLQEQTIQQQRQRQLLIIGLAVLLSIVLLLVYTNYRNKKRLSTVLAIKNQEKELLLKEIHHRVKNNLQTISSLLNLQSAQIKDKEIQGAVIESKNRVRSMALIHQKLYQGENLAAIEMKEYLRMLSENMIKSFGRHRELELLVEMPAIEVDVDTAIPIGLITNELLTNTLKYAFPGGQTGLIQVSLTHNTSENQMQLKLSDNGVGVNSQGEVPDERRTNFGSQLVKLLTTQLDGTMTVNTTIGYETIINFKKFKVYSPSRLEASV
jgi:two-component sensor histidine kinase